MRNVKLMSSILRSGRGSVTKVGFASSIGSDMWTILDLLRADAVFGWRQIVKKKVTSAAAILSLALAIGACTAAFRLIDAMLLRPLPVAHPERLYVFARQGKDPAGNFRISESCEYPLFRELRATAKDQAELIAISYATRMDLTYGSDEETEKASWQYVSGWMFLIHSALAGAGAAVDRR